MVSVVLLSLYSMYAYVQEKSVDEIRVELGRTAEEYYNIGNWYSERNQHYKAIAYYNAAIGKKPLFCKAIINLGLSYRALDKIDDAIATYQSALDSKCKEHFIYLNLGNALVTAGKLREASFSYRTYTELENYDPDGYLNLGLTLYRLDDYSEAAKAFEKLLLLSKDDSYFLFQAARCYAKLKDHNKTLEKARAALEIDPQVRFALLQEEDFKDFRRSSQFKQLLEMLNDLNRSDEPNQ